MHGDISTKRRLSIIAVICAVFWMLLYVWIYVWGPFSEMVNLILTNFIELIPPILCAVILTLVVGYYQHGEPPRRIWLMFAVSIWSWTVADLIWSIYNITVGEVPSISVADFLWLAGYIFFSISLIGQFQLTTFNRSSQYYWAGAVIWLGIILITLGIMTLVSEGTLEDFFTFFYPVADFAIGVAALSLVVSFRSGTLARPWLGLFAFVVADVLYLWTTLTGTYDWVSRSSFLTFLSEAIYALAYLFLGWGAFSQLLALRYGATVDERDTKPNQSPKLKTETAP